MCNHLDIMEILCYNLRHVNDDGFIVHGKVGLEDCRLFLYDQHQNDKSEWMEFHKSLSL